MRKKKIQPTPKEQSRATLLFKEFFESEKAGGLLLLGFTVISLLIANSVFGHGYHDFFQKQLGEYTLEHWINDGLMTIFFLLVGLELEREIYLGELSNIKDAMLPLFSALGGMLVPAATYLFFNMGTPSQSGAGIPMATDIAFALGILSLLGKRVPISLKIFLTALAVIDDLGAILVIAIFYTKSLQLNYLYMALGIMGFLFVLNRMKVGNLIPYLVGGFFMWYLFLHSGVHATISGVLLAFVIPFGDGGKKSTSYILQKALHKPVAFIILPIFALANTAIAINLEGSQLLDQAYFYGIALGLIFGKPLGIFLFGFIAVKFRFCKLPTDLNWKSIFGAGILGGIGFTMSIFITLLAFDDEVMITNAKLIILVSSLIAGVLGLLTLNQVLSPEKKPKTTVNLG